MPVQQYIPNPLKGKKVLIVLPSKNFKDAEYYSPRELFDSMGIRVTTTSTSKEAISVWNKSEEVDIILDKATVNYDAVVFIGGPGADEYFENEKAMNLARDFFKAKKIVAAICIAPSILANAGILEGKKATAFPSEETNLLNKGADYTGELVTVDGNIITGKNPGAAREFASQIIKILGQ